MVHEAASTQACKSTKSILLLVLWTVWKERNRRIFDSKEKTVERILAEIQDEISIWALAGGRHLTLRD